MVRQESRTSVTSTIVYNYEDKLKEKKHGLPEKVFSHRESVITVLFENPHVKTLHHISMALFLGLCIITLTKGYLEDGEPASGFRIISAGFRGFHISLLIWLFIYSLVLCVYFCFLAWSKLRLYFLPKSQTRQICDILGITILLGYFTFSFFFIVHIISIYNLPTGSAAVILAEQTRMLMKVYAFVRSNVPKILKFKEKSDGKLVLPTFKYFVFFTWVPTLVYRDEYPRTNKIRWNKVLSYTSEILATVLFYSFVLERFLVPLYKDFGIKKFSRSQIFLAYLESIFPGGMYLVVTFYLILHLVQNLFAELLCFGDRMFYKDWWTATDFPTYYRKWNVVVHDWLYAYVYKDCYEILLPGSKNAAKYVTFFLSSVVHEWIVSNMLGYFMPIMFIQFFGIGTIITYVKIPQNGFFNMLFWLCLAMGSGIMITAYGLEFYARFNDVPSSTGRFDFYIPRILTCSDCYSD